MATHNVTMLNPTGASVTVNGQTVQAGKTAQVTLSDATTDLHSFVDAGCVVTSAVSPGKVACAACGYKHLLGEVLKPYYLP
jgi:hypothetical protein